MRSRSERRRGRGVAAGGLATDGGGAFDGGAVGAGADGAGADGGAASGCRRLFSPEAHDLVQPVGQALRGRVLRVDVECLPGEGVGAAIVASIERDAGQPDDRDGVARIGLGCLAVQPLGLLELADRQCSLGLQDELDHGRLTRRPRCGIVRAAATSPGR